MQKRCKQTRKGHACSVFFCAVWVGFVLFTFVVLFNHGIWIEANR